MVGFTVLQLLINVLNDHLQTFLNYLTSADKGEITEKAGEFSD
jgi:hypothetical protein